MFFIKTSNFEYIIVPSHVCNMLAVKLIGCRVFLQLFVFSGIYFFTNIFEICYHHQTQNDPINLFKLSIFSV